MLTNKNVCIIVMMFFSFEYVFYDVWITFWGYTNILFKSFYHMICIVLHTWPSGINKAVKCFFIHKLRETENILLEQIEYYCFFFNLSYKSANTLLYKNFTIEQCEFSPYSVKAFAYFEPVICSHFV